MAGNMNLLILLSMGCVALGLGTSHGEGMKRFKLNCTGFNSFVNAEMPLDTSLSVLCNVDKDKLVPELVKDEISDHTITVTASLNCSEADPVVVTQETSLDNIGDIMLILDKEAKQLYCKLRVKIEATHTTMESMVFVSSPISVILNEPLSDDANMMVSVTSDAEITVSNGQLKDALTLGQITVQQTNLGLETDECVFVVAFLRPIDQELSTCNELDTIDETTGDMFPYIQMGDTIVGVKCLTKDNINVDVREFLQNPGTDLCGTFHFVVQADPMGTFYGEKNRCDNTKSFTVTLTCATEAEMKPPMCEMVSNIFNPCDIGFMIRSMVMNKEGTQKESRRKIYNYKRQYGMDMWIESLAGQDNSYDVKLHGFSLLKIIWKYIMDTKSTECQTVTDVNPALMSLEGQVSADFTGVHDAVFNAAFLKKGLLNAELQSLYNEMSADGLGSFTERISYNITRTVYMRLIQDVSTSMPVMDGDMDRNQMDKKVEKMVKKVISQGTSMTEEELLYAVRNLTGIMVELKLHFTQNTCFNKVYDKLMNYIRNIRESTTDNLNADIEPLFQNIELIKKISGMSEGFPKKNASELEVSGCIKRIDGYLDSKCEKDYMDMTPEIRTNICLMNEFRKYINERKSFLKFNYIRAKLQKAEDMDDNDMEESKKDLKEDPLRIIASNYNPWIMNNKGEFIKYMVNPTLDKVCMRKMATCQCQECHDGEMGDGMDGGKSDGGMDGAGLFGGTGGNTDGDDGVL